MRRVGALEAEGFGAQQYRAAPAERRNSHQLTATSATAAMPSCHSLNPAKMPTVFRNESERPLIAANNPPRPPTTLVASKMVRSRPVLSFSIARGWTVSPIKFYQDRNRGATRI